MTFSDSIATPSSGDLHGDLVRDLPRLFVFRLELLAQLGIRLAEFCGVARADPGRLRIGWVQIEPGGTIAIRPCEDITFEHFEELARCALRARLVGATPTGRWRNLSGGPVTAVFVRTD